MRDWVPVVVGVAAGQVVQLLLGLRWRKLTEEQARATLVRRLIIGVLTVPTTTGFGIWLTWTLRH